MRIGIASYFFPRGGSAHAIRATAEGMSRRGVEVQLVAGSLKGAQPEHDASEFYGGLLTRAHDYADANKVWAKGDDPMACPVPMHGSYELKVGVPDRDFSEISPDLAQFQIEAWKRTLRSLPGDHDLLHLHHLTPLTIAARALWPNVPIVTTLHGTELKWLARERLGSSNGAYWSALMTRAATQSDVLIALSRQDASLARSILGPAVKRIEVIGGGVDIDVFRPPVRRPSRAPGAETGGTETHFICVARFIHAKRVPMLLRAWQIAERSIGFNGRLTVVGGIAEEVEGENPILLARSLRLQRVAFAPPVAQHELPAILRAADVFVLPSVGESFGQVFFEALACGLPVVACRSGAPGELLASHSPRLGWFSMPDQTAELATHLIQAASAPLERQERGESGRRLVVETYGWDHVVKRLISLYEELVPSRSSN